MEHDQERLHSNRTRSSLSLVRPIDCTRYLGNVRSRLPFLDEAGCTGWFTGVVPRPGGTRSGACVRTGGNDRCCVTSTYERVLIVGAGDGLSAQICVRYTAPG